MHAMQTHTCFKLLRCVSGIQINEGNTETTVTKAGSGDYCVSHSVSQRVSQRVRKLTNFTEILTTESYM